MSYVYCGYCGQRGHNKLGCPQRKRDARENPDSYLAKQIAREQEARQRAVSNRRCTYCSEKGHNRRGCNQLKQDQKDLFARQGWYVHRVATACQKAGFSPGSLIRIPAGDPGPDSDPWGKEVLALVEGFKWNNIDFLNYNGDIAQDWSLQRRDIISARVVSTKGWEEESDNYWGSTPPKQGSKIGVQLMTLVEAIPEITSEENISKVLDRNQPQVQLLGPAGKGLLFSPNPVFLTESVIDRFNLSPRKGASDWDKNRLNSGSFYWDGVGTKKDE